MKKSQVSSVLFVHAFLYLSSALMLEDKRCANCE
jgi:hypothetical protein